MLRALLLDIDDTLLINDWDAFFPVYLDLLTRYLADLVPPERVAVALNAGTEAMAKADGSQGTLDRLFVDRFVAVAGCDQQRVVERFDQFYRDEFNRLQWLTAPDPASADLVAVAKEQGLKLAIATQPYFPREAVLVRLRWAGVPAETVGYDYIPAYDSVTACKPHPAFFQSILAALDVAAPEALMVGDSVQTDMAAGRLGIKTYYVERGRNDDGSDVRCDARGTLSDLVKMIRTGAIHDL